MCTGWPRTGAPWGRGSSSENNTKLHRIAVTAHGNRTIKMRYLPTDTGVSHAVTGSDTNGYFRDSEKNEWRRAKKWMENDGLRK